MERHTIRAKIAVVAVLIIGLTVVADSQTRQMTGPNLPESRLRVDPVDNTVKSVATEDMQRKINDLERENADLKNRIVALETRVTNLETEIKR